MADTKKGYEKLAWNLRRTVWKPVTSETMVVVECNLGFPVEEVVLNFESLREAGMKTCFIRQGPENTFTAHRVDFLPLLVIVQNAKSKEPFVKFFLNDDARGNPRIRFDFQQNRMTLYDPKAPEFSERIGLEELEKHSVNGRLIDHHKVIDITAQALHASLYLGVDVQLEFGFHPTTGAVLISDIIEI